MTWFAVQTQPRAEPKARANLERQGYAVYAPRLRRRRRHARRVENVLVPLFPGYVFVDLDPKGGAWRPINSTLGVVRLVCFGETPAPVPRGVIEGLRELEGEDGIVRPPETPLPPGQSVRILDGTLAGQIGILLDASDAERVRLLVRMLGRDVQVAVDPERFEKLDPS
jgi:transcriptional antiterminator RfaH